ncbi:MAG: hypothetical protein WBE17_05520 [Anaerolineae bacterium]
MNGREALPKNRRRGSHPRCLMFMEGDRQDVAGRLTALVGLANVDVDEDDSWMPRGLPKPTGDGGWDREPTREATLGEDEGFLSPEHLEIVTHWWLEVAPRANTPNWDIASTCQINGKRGMLLIEAKAHDRELSSSGKPEPTTPNGMKNHEKIGAAIKQASADLNRIEPGWALSRDSHYQLSNRFAWSWKLTQLGVPVILVYLGFLHAGEMADQGESFANHEAWVRTVKAYARGLVPGSAWDNCLLVNDTLMWTLIRSVEVKLN